MRKILFNSWMMVLLATPAILIIMIIANRDEPTPRIALLVEQSAERQGISESDSLDINPLMTSDLVAAIIYIERHVDYTSYHLLMAIRQYYPAYYEKISNDVKASILCSALKNTNYLNDWGWLDPTQSADGDSAYALLETKKTALIYLVPLLDDNNPAPHWGSKGATISATLLYRRKDFAFRYASLILGQSPSFYKDLDTRDRDIEILTNKIKNITE